MCSALLTMGQAGDPSEAVERAFGRVAAGMAGLPICNPALAVEAVGFRRWEDAWLGVLVAPWTISLMLVPARPSGPSGPSGSGGASTNASRVRRLADGERQRWRLPSGEYEFLGGDEREVGPFQACSLLSPVAHVVSQDEAREIARSALAAILTASEPPALPAEPPPRAPEGGPPAPSSRRAFLTFGRSR